ncbi:hypothetical protein K461DRAFT_279317 [Myriangium duriaei CBS 260.36]|uniref:Uncharacterized protein n=1 Tax=Myriangium duriaei CBS 260.36 TaxID=1168546 RepID=A0A9P4MJ74_9PEZI|nr:hypothetical protein K461DRAFT_279317 [Myriangium duriaei CBS 260.36]
MSLASSGTLSTPSLPNPMHSTTSLSAPTLSLAEDFAGAELIVRGPWSAPMEHTRDFEIVLNKIRTSHSDEFVPPEGAVWGSAPFRKRTLTNSTSSEGRSSPFTLVTPELPQTESDKDEMTVKVKAKAKAKSLDDGKIIGKDWAEGYDGPQNMHKTGDSTSRSSPMLDKFDKFVNLVSRRQRKNTL